MIRTVRTIALCLCTAAVFATSASAHDHGCQPGSHDFDGTCVPDVNGDAVKTYSRADCNDECRHGEQCVAANSNSGTVVSLYVCAVPSNSSSRPPHHEWRGCSIRECGARTMGMPNWSCHGGGGDGGPVCERHHGVCQWRIHSCRPRCRQWPVDDPATFADAPASLPVSGKVGNPNDSQQLAPVPYCDDSQRLLLLFESLPADQRLELLQFFASLDSKQRDALIQFVSSLDRRQFGELERLLRDPDATKLERFFEDLSPSQQQALLKFVFGLNDGQRDELLRLLTKHWRHWRRHGCGPNTLLCRPGTVSVCRHHSWTCQRVGVCEPGDALPACPNGQQAHWDSQACRWSCHPIGVCDPSGPAPHCPQGHANWDSAACRWVCPRPTDHCGGCAAGQHCEQKHCGWNHHQCGNQVHWQCVPDKPAPPVCVLDCIPGYHPVYQTPGSCAGATCEPNVTQGGRWCGCGPAGYWLKPGETCPDSCRYTM